MSIGPCGSGCGAGSPGAGGGEVDELLLDAGDGVAITDPSTRVESEALRASLSVTL